MSVIAGLLGLLGKIHIMHCTFLSKKFKVILVTLETLVETVKSHPEQIEFEEVMTAVAEHFDYSPTKFNNGTIVNEAGTNEGSCKVFALAQQLDLNELETLALFGRYYRDDVLTNPEGTDHGNIRNFMKTGWSGIEFEHAPLTPKG